MGRLARQHICPRIVHPNVDLSAPSPRPFDQRFVRRLLGKVAYHHLGLDAQGTHLAGHLFRPRHIPPSVDQHRGPGLGKLPGNSPANAARRTRHHRGLQTQDVHHVALRSVIPAHASTQRYLPSDGIPRPAKTSNPPFQHNAQQK